MIFYSKKNCLDPSVYNVSLFSGVVYQAQGQISEDSNIKSYGNGKRTCPTEKPYIRTKYYQGIINVLSKTFLGKKEFLREWNDSKKAFMIT